MQRMGLQHRTFVMCYVNTNLIGWSDRPHKLLRLIGVLFLFIGLPVAAQNVVTVSNANDDVNGNVSSVAALIASDGGDGISLREAITAANNTVNVNTATPDEIHFGISGDGPHTISLNYSFPTITDPATIDGYTQAGATPGTETTNAILKIVLDGSNINVLEPGLQINAGYCAIKGLVMNGFSSCIKLTSPGNRIEGNFIGTNADGTSVVNNGNGVEIFDSPNNTIGGLTPAERNIISGSDNGILIVGTNAIGNQVQGNFIGTDITGTVALGNSIGVLLGAPNNTIGYVLAMLAPTSGGNIISGNNVGVYITTEDLPTSSANGNIVASNFIGTDVTGTIDLGNNTGVLIIDASNNIIGETVSGAGNVISGNDNTGVSISFDELPSTSTTGNVVQGNFIGTDASGTEALGNDIGVDIRAPNNTVGGTLNGSRNIISGNVNGVIIDGDEITVQGNFIGTDVTGIIDLGNFYNGVLIFGYDNTVGGTAFGVGNLISGNGIGIEIAGGSNTIQGNLIGTDLTGTLPLGNGIGVSTFGEDNVVGGIVSGAGNIIAFNANAGVNVADNGIGRSILGNSIFSNGTLGIDLQDDGVTTNDAGDSDIGPNNLQNFPVLISVVIYDASPLVQIAIEGTINSTPNTTLRIEFFSNPTCDPSGHGEGQTFLGFLDVITDGSGNETFSPTLVSLPIPSGSFITATATDLDNNTSEFSQCLQDLNTPTGTSVEVNPVDATTLTAPAALTFDNISQTGVTTLATSSSGPPPPSGFNLGDPPTHYELSTTAIFSGTIEVCIDYSNISFSDETQLKLFHFEGGVWIDRTTSLDTDNNIICGNVTSLSPFAIFEAVQSIKPFVFLANKVTLKRTKQDTPEGDIHSNGTLTVEKGDPSTYESNLTAVGKITIQKDNTINGDVTSQTSISNSGTINGTPSVGTVANEPLPSLSYSAGGVNKTVPSGGTLSLAPGSYGIVTINSGGELKLSSGEYFMKELRGASSGIEIEIDLTSDDPITINVESNLQLGKEAEIRLLPNGQTDSELVTFNTKQTSSVNFGKEAYLLGSFNAPNAKVTLVKNTQLRGSICAKEILVERDCLFLHHDATGSLPGPGNLPKSSFDDDEEEVSSDQLAVISDYALAQNYPNPFNPTTTISFALREASEVSLSIFNTNGQLVKKLVAGEMNAGSHSFTWDATNERGERVASGVYLYVIKAGAFSAQRKLVLMK